MPPDPPSSLIDPRLRQRRGRVVFPARRPTLLVVPLAAVTEIGGVLCLVGGAPIGWFICAAPGVALILTGIVLRPTLELTSIGLVQRQYPFSSMTRWEVIDHFGITRAGNRLILGYRLVEGIPPPRRQPAAALLRTAGRPFDGGYFADAMAGDPEQILTVLSSYLRDPALRETLPAPRQ